MQNDTVYERDYREAHKLMGAYTYTEEKEEAFQSALKSGVYKSIDERIHELPHILNPVEKAAYDKCLAILERYAARWGGYIKGVVSYKSYDASIELDLPFHEFIVRDNMDDLVFIAQNARYVLFSPMEDGRVQLILRFNYFEEVGDVEAIIEEELQKRPDLCESLMRSHNSEIEQILSNPYMVAMIEPEAERLGLTVEEYLVKLNQMIKANPKEFAELIDEELRRRHNKKEKEE